MSVDSLPHFYHVQLDATTWCATAKLTIGASDSGKSKRMQQRVGVRALLHTLLKTLSMPDTLDETQFPYRLINSGYYVSFSHSGDTVAVAIGHKRTVGVDIETNTVNWTVAKRFFHKEETALLAALPKAERDMLTKWSWQLKESFIKVHQYKLAYGLGFNYVDIIARINLSLVTDTEQIPTIYDSKSEYQIAMLLDQQVIVVY